VIIEVFFNIRNKSASVSFTGVQDFVHWCILDTFMYLL
jgi:hypothetical protein